MDLAIFDEQVIKRLWACGLLRADYVESDHPVAMPGLTEIHTANGRYVYSDERPVEHHDVGFGEIFSKQPEVDGFDLSFHPFRLYVLHHVDRVFESSTTATQYLSYPPGHERLARLHVDQLDNWTSTKEAAERFDYWNQVAELAIACEPVSYAKIFKTIRWGGGYEEEDIQGRIQEQRQALTRILKEETASYVDEMRQSLVHGAEIVDGNKTVHVLLRLISAQERHRLKGRLGLAMLLITMAESIRRASELSLGRLLPEEDEIGFGQWMEGARKSLYGTERITDASDDEVREFLSTVGLHSGVRVRVYTEGDTESGALAYAVHSGAGVEYINLRGKFVQRGTGGLAFIESTKSDMKHKIFSVALLDADRADNVRALRRAAADRHFFGRFWVAEPDFEFANFDAGELVEIVQNCLEQRQAAGLPPLVLQEAMRAKTGSDLFRALSSAHIRDFAKSAAWGQGLMKYAMQKPTLPEGHPRAGQHRPIIEAAQLLIRARAAGYLRSVEMYKTDPITGSLIEKKI